MRALPTPKVGSQFRQWLVIGTEPVIKKKRRCILCVCLGCHREKAVLIAELLHGKTTQCRPCARKQIVQELRQRNGFKIRNQHRAEYASWKGMAERCRNKNEPNYGGRGIKVFPEWLGRGGFERFFSYVGPKLSPLHSLDRYPDANGNYEPGNVRWATRNEQSRNRRSNRLITYNGRTMCAVEWGEELGLKQPQTILGTRADPDFCAHLAVVSTFKQVLAWIGEVATATEITPASSSYIVRLQTRLQTAIRDENKRWFTRDLIDAADGRIGIEDGRLVLS